MPRYLVIEDLYRIIGESRVRDFLDDDNTGNLSAHENAIVADILVAAEGEVDSYLMRSFGRDQITDLANADASLKRHAAWIALHFATERRSEFLGQEGAGAYGEQYKRAIAFCNNLSKGLKRSTGEGEAGKSKRLGGVVQPAKQTNESKFCFAPDRTHPSGHGGF